MSRISLVFIPLLCLALNAGAREHERHEGRGFEGQPAYTPVPGAKPGHVKPERQPNQAPTYQPREKGQSWRQGRERHSQNTRRAGRRSGFRREEPPRAVPRHFHDLGVRGVPAVLKHGQRMDSDREHSVVAFPKAGPSGRPFRAELLARERMGQPLVHDHLRALVQDRVFLGDLQRFNREEVVGGRYYWHAWRGIDYCHYYDPWGYHWYGWHLGPSFFWTRYYRGTWWCYDPVFVRWSFWYDGFWWWEDPLRFNVVYIYNGSDYVSSDENVPPTPEVTAPDVPDIPALPTPETATATPSIP